MSSKMDRELKAKWIKALRSGKYRQGHGYLNEGGNFCCLGVLCDVVDPDGWTDDYLTVTKGHRLSRGHRLLSQSTKESLGIMDHASKLMDMNDGTNEVTKSFVEIADYIEENL